MLNVQDVHVHIGKLHILQGVTFDIKPGDSAALLGRNGVGKTTTLRAIMGLVPRSGGAISFDGVNHGGESRRTRFRATVSGMCRKGAEFSRTSRFWKTFASE